MDESRSRHERESDRTSSVQRYEIRFKMRFRDKATLMGGGSDQFSSDPSERAASQKISPVRNLPDTEDYKLYDVHEGTRAPAVRSVESYTVTEVTRSNGDVSENARSRTLRKPLGGQLDKLLKLMG
jgi:hypothetical protein